MATVGEILAELRQERGLTQKQLGEILRVSTGTISNYENGVHLPDALKLVSLADYFQVSTDYLLGRTRIRETQADLQKKLAENRTVYDTIKTFLKLPTDLQKSVAHIISSLQFNIMIDEYQKKDGS